VSRLIRCDVCGLEVGELSQDWIRGRVTLGVDFCHEFDACRGCEAELGERLRATYAPKPPNPPPSSPDPRPFEFRIVPASGKVPEPKASPPTAVILGDAIIAPGGRSTFRKVVQTPFAPRRLFIVANGTRSYANMIDALILRWVSVPLSPEGEAPAFARVGLELSLELELGADATDWAHVLVWVTGETP